MKIERQKLKGKKRESPSLHDYELFQITTARESSQTLWLYVCLSTSLSSLPIQVDNHTTGLLLILIIKVSIILSHALEPPWAQEDKWYTFYSASSIYHNHNLKALILIDELLFLF